jgi:hypothetical protein
MELLNGKLPESLSFHKVKPPLLMRIKPQVFIKVPRSFAEDLLGLFGYRYIPW